MNPTPEIEQHYHIKMLIENQQKRVNDRELYRIRDKESQDRDGAIRDAKDVIVTEFWCNTCRKDFRGLSFKQVETDWSSSAQRIAFYKTKCRCCGAWAIRLITDKGRDGFWMRSRLVAADRGKHYADTIQPWQTGFQLLYGRKNQ